MEPQTQAVTIPKDRNWPWVKYKQFHLRICIWKCYPQNFNPFVPGQIIQTCLDHSPLFFLHWYMVPTQTNTSHTPHKELLPAHYLLNANTMGDNTEMEIPRWCDTTQVKVSTFKWMDFSLYKIHTQSVFFPSGLSGEYRSTLKTLALLELNSLRPGDVMWW